MPRNKQKKEPAPKAAMKKPKWRVGDLVEYTFLGQPGQGRVAQLRKNPLAIDRWVYDLVDIVSGMKIPFVGVDGSEKFANISSEKSANFSPK